MTGRCRIVVDTSIVWHIAFETSVAPAALGVVSGLARLCNIVYTKYNIEDVEGNEKLTEEEKTRLIRAYQRIAIEACVELNRMQVLGRFGSWVKRMGPMDVLIAVAAKKLEAFLLTADWEQFMFYRFLGGNAIYLPLHRLQEAVEDGTGEEGLC